MTFKSSEELKTYLLSKMQAAIKQSEEKIYIIIRRFIDQYYSEFNPEMYVRTYQLYISLVKSEIIQTANGYKAEIYFDSSLMDHSLKYRKNGKAFHNKGWSEDKTMSSAAHGSHGGYVPGTAIYDDPLSIISKEAINILKDMLIAEGIPVR